MSPERFVKGESERTKRPRASQTALPQNGRTRCYAQVDAGNGLEPINACHKSDSGTLVRSLTDSFRCLVIHPERHCLRAPPHR